MVSVSFTGAVKFRGNTKKKKKQNTTTKNKIYKPRQFLDKSRKSKKKCYKYSIERDITETIDITGILEKGAYYKAKVSSNYSTIGYDRGITFTCNY